MTRPVDLPMLRRDMLAHWRAVEGQRVWHHISEQGGFLNGAIPGDPPHSAGILDEEIIRWRMADLFYVTDEMAQLALTAGRSLPSFQLRREDLPSDFGLLYFERPIGTSKETPRGWTAYLTACLWGIRPNFTSGGQSAVWLSFYTDPDEPLRRLRSELAPADYVKVRSMVGPLGYDDELAWPLDLPDDADRIVTEADTKLGWGCTVRAAWLLMQQQIASVRRLSPRRAEVKLARRRKLDLARVRIVSLRHRHQEPCGPQSGGREYAHRWVVRGHWRNQWYPAQQRHVPIWIQAHVKGPEGAPMLTGDVVNVWRR